MTWRANRRTLVVISIVLMAFLSPAAGMTIYVDDDGPADFNDIQAAINVANNGDIVIVQPGTYTGNGNRDIYFLGKAITVRGATGEPNDCIIDCQGNSTNPHWGFYFGRGEDVNSVLEAITITNGYGYSHGGAVYCTHSSPTISNCIISNNYAPLRGGGMFNDNSSPNINNCIFINNSASSAGGGICNIYHSHASINNCTFSYNSARYSGGAIYNRDSCFPIIRNCLINNNSATYTGGSGGGGILNHDSSPSIINCSIINNSATNSGSGIVDYDSSYSSIINCIIWGNQPSQIHAKGTVTYCNVQGGWPRLGNIDADPCFVDVNDGDYHLKSQAGRWDPNSESWVRDDVTSPCIDAGNPGCPEANEPAPNDNRINMGAYGGTAEASKSPTYWRSISDMTNDWIVDSNDLKAFADYWLETGDCIPNDLDRSQFVDFNDFTIIGGQWRQEGPGPGITYDIGGCIKDAYGSLVTELAIEPRFSVQVEGNNIHFAKTCLPPIAALMRLNCK